MSYSSQHYVRPALDPFDRRMEGLKSASLGAMGSLLRKLDELVPTEGRVRQLRDDLGSISTKLRKLSEVDKPSLTVNYWMKDVRELSYDLEDCVDQFIHADDNLLGFKNRLLDNILGFKSRLMEAIQRYDRFNLEHALSHHTTTLNHRIGMVHQEPGPVIPVGLEGPTNELRQLVEPRSDLQLKVVSILGDGGVGKSMLSQKLWCEVGGQFECRAFVQTARKPDIMMILRSILSQIRKQQPSEGCEVANLIHDIRKHLQDKSMGFIIIDDLWAVSVWDVVSRAFPKGNCCGRIITTTTIEDVALACCSYDPEYILKMKPLSEDQSKKLFLDTVSGPGKEYSSEVSDVSDEITRKCGGLPLAIICIGTLIASQQDTLHQSEYVKNFLYHNVITNSTSVGILNEVLELCYSSLPHCLKSCLLYLSVYPENYLILKEDLMKQWIAEEFFSATEKDIVEAASSYFDMLVRLRLIQRMDFNCNKQHLWGEVMEEELGEVDPFRLSYVVHPTVFDFITCKSMENNFITIIDYSQSIAVLKDKIHRLSLHFCSATYATTPASIGVSQVRTLSFVGLLSCMPSLAEFKLVRVMILHLQGVKGNTRFPLPEVCNLSLLRYLQVRSNVTIKLPDKMGCLTLLETLEVKAEVASVPSDILHIPKLRHVCLGTETRHKHHPGDEQTETGPVSSSNAVFPDVLSNAVFSDALEEFELLPLPPIYIFSRLPGWIQLFHGLRILSVTVRELWAHDVDHLAKLPLLTRLSLCVGKNTGKRVVTFRRGAFPALEYFKLVSGMLLLSFREEAVPNLRILEIRFNVHPGDKYRHMLGGIQNLLKLKKVVASIGVATGAEDNDCVSAESALQDAVDRHPRRPTFIKGERLVDPVAEEYDPPEIRESPPQEIESSRIDVQKETLPIIKQPGIPEKQPARGSSSSKPPPPWRQSQNKIWTRSWPTGHMAHMEVTMGTLSGSVDRLLVTLGALLEHEHTLPSSIRGKIHSIGHELSILRARILQWESIDKCSNYAANWFSRVRDLCFDIEDWADLFALRVNSHGEDKLSVSSFSGWVYHAWNKLTMPLSAIYVEIQYFEKCARVLSDDGSWRYYNRYGVELPTVAQHTGHHLLFGLRDPIGLIGQDGVIEEVTKKLMNVRGMGELNILSITGMAGSGKSMIATAVYQGLQQEFHRSIFVSIGSERNRVTRTLKSMLWQLVDKQGSGGDIFGQLEMELQGSKDDNLGHQETEQLRTEDIDELHRKIRESLKNKRYLIVVDDLCSEEHWDTIESCFPEDNTHSRIIITTRNDALALHCSLGLSDCIYKIGLLSDADSKQLFMNTVFGTRHDCLHSLEDISNEILTKCGGLPLAIVSVAAKLGPAQSNDEWRRIWLNMLSNPESNYLMQRLNLAYNDLPAYLRICMLYLSIFPEYYEIDVERLVRLWIAEEFIVEESGRTMEETARSYLDGLISRNMVLPLHVNHDGIPKSCRVHPVIHSFIAYKSRVENFVVIVDDQDQVVDIRSGNVRRQQDVDIRSGNVRRLSLQSSKNRERNMVLNGSIDLSHARSVIMNGQDSTALRFTGLRVVRVLDLEGCGGTVCLDGLHNLQLLRYLSLRGTDVSELPEIIGELSCLQTLDVRSTNVKKLPHSIVKLEKLMHLLCGKNVKLPRGIAKMKALQTVSCAIVMNSSSSIMQELSELTDLRELELFYDFTEMPENGRIVKFPGYGFQHLEKLRIHSSSASVTFEPGVLPSVEILELSFDGLPDEKSTGLSGIEYLLSLKNVLLEFSQDEARAVAMMVDAAWNAAATDHPNHPEVTVIVDGRPLGSTIA